MKRWTAVVGLAVATWLAAGSVEASDDQVPDATLKLLGLGGMTKASDAHGMQVRAKGLQVTLTILRPLREQQTVEQRSIVVLPVEEQITVAVGGRNVTLTLVRPVIEQRIFTRSMTVIRLVPEAVTLPRGGGGPGPP